MQVQRRAAAAQRRPQTASRLVHKPQLQRNQGRQQAAAPNPSRRGGVAPGRALRPLEVACAAAAPAAAQHQVPQPPTSTSSSLQSPPPPPPYRTLTEIWPAQAAARPDAVAVSEPHNPDAHDLTYAQLHAAIQGAAAGMAAAGLAPGDVVALVAEASSRWLVADQAVKAVGAATAVRGSTAPPEELAYIVRHSGCTALVAHDAAALARVPQAARAGLKFTAVLWGPAPEGALTWEALVAKSGGAPPPAVTVSPDDVATIVFTSGTGGHPKGVQLTHANLAYQVNNLGYFVPVSPGDSCLSLLPPWHVYQMTCSLYIHACGGRIVYTTLRKFRDDLAAVGPDHLVAVPLVLDTLHARITARILTPAGEPSAVKRAVAGALLAASTKHVAERRPGGNPLVAALLAPLHAAADRLLHARIRAALGVRRTIISGGGSLAAHLDTFFEAVGIPVVNGYGMTETSPVITCRRVAANARGTVGVPVPGTEVRVLPPDAGAVGGRVLVRGPGVMTLGYLGDPVATAAAFPDGDGWLDTGDLGRWVDVTLPGGGPPQRMLVLTGRAKDALVLSSGKNVEPGPIEDAIAASPLVKHALVLGQDKRELGVLVFPDIDAAAAAGVGDDPAALAQRITADVRALNEARPSYSSEQHIAVVRVVAGGVLSPDDGTLTRTMKVRRAEVAARYKDDVAALLTRLR